MYRSRSFNREASLFQRLEGNMRHLDDLIDTDDLDPSEHQSHQVQNKNQGRKSGEMEDDRHQDHGLSSDGAASETLGKLPHALHDPSKRRFRAASPQWSIATLRSADNIPSISKEQLVMEAEDSPWGGS